MKLDLSKLIRVSEGMLDFDFKPDVKPGETISFDMTYGLPKVGDEFERDGIRYRIVECDLATGHLRLKPLSILC